MLGRSSIADRGPIVAGPLAPLATSLAADLDRLLPDEDVFVPDDKARMTRKGGRCERDGAFLEFDPASPRRHRCPSCGSVYEGEEHYRWWIMGYQLWLAERAVHAGALWRVARHPRHRRLAEAILHKLADRYHTYPNEDNVLGPTRVFFSTYLESIWSLQLAVATWLLEDTPGSSVGDRVRERVLEPSSELVGQFDEGLSNRQVWNSAALGAAGVLLGRPGLVERALFSAGGLQDFLRSGLLEDGSWYEGENYHLFAHRGLWYLMMIADAVGAGLPGEAVRRFDGGFAAPLKTALPDFTFPARRDSQYGVSLRQWRIAESFELGLSRIPGSPELAGGLRRLYSEAEPGDAARWRSTAEAERNVPGVRLTRADLGWKSLLFALPRLPEAPPPPPGSVLMPGQGFAVVRRDHGRIYAALDYGHRGGSHGHPDRLNLWLVIGDQRVFEDVGTGSYVERTLHWYRSTLAHNAPLIDARSQDPVSGTLRAWDERGDHAWVDAEAPVAIDGVLVRRSLVVSPGHLVDRLEWTANREVMLDLPMHIDGDIEGARWEPGALAGGSGLEDGFDFVSEPETTPSPATPCHVTASEISGSVIVDASHAWWRGLGPGAPGQPARRFLLLRAGGQRGCLTSVWSWSGRVDLRASGKDSLDVTVAGQRFSHRLVENGWRVRGPDGVDIQLGGRQSPPRPAAGRTTVRRIAEVIPVVRRRDILIGDLTSSAEGLRVELGESHYRRTEATWTDAGSPRATVVIGATESELLVEVSVAATEPFFSATQSDNPLDNEHPDTNSDGVQLHVTRDASDGVRLAASWLLVPERDASSVRVTGRDGFSAIPLVATWRRTAMGWQLLARLERHAFGAADAVFGLDVIVNERPRWRERRRGQLALSGGGWAYLRGDRQDADRLIPMVIQHG